MVEAADVNAPAINSSVDNLVRALTQHEDFTPPFNVVKNEAGNVMYVEVPTVAGVDEAAVEESVRCRRSVIVPEAFAGSLANTYVSGQAAGSVDRPAPL